MPTLIFILISGFEIFALYNRGGGPLLSHLALILAAFCAIAAALIFHFRIKLRIGLPQLGYALFLAIFVASLIFSVTPQYGLAELLLFGSTFIFLVILSSLEISRKSLEYFAAGLIAMACAGALVGFFIYTRTAFPRFVGTFIDLSKPYTSFANDFADFSLLVLPIAVFCMLKKHGRRTTTILAVIATAVIFTGFLLSFSRAAWFSFAGLIVLSVIWIIVRRKQMPKLRIGTAATRLIAMFVLTAALMGLLQFDRSQKFETVSLYKKLTFQADEGASSVAERAQFWDGAVRLIKDKPILGSGVLSFKYLYPKYQRIFGIVRDHPHNIFLKIGVENGVFAAAAFLLFLIASAAVILPFLWKNPASIAFPFALGALGALAHNNMDYNFISSNYTLFIVFTAVCLSFAYSANKARITAGAAKISILILLFLIGAELGAIGAHEGFYNIYFKKGREFLAAGNYEKAVSYLEESQALIFKRDLVNYLSEAYKGFCRKTGEEKCEFGNKDLIMLEEETVQSADASIFSGLGEIYLGKGEKEKALRIFEKSLQLNPSNELKYYYLYLKTQTDLKQPISEEMGKRVLRILGEYTEALRENRHFTVTTENPKYASALYGFLGMQSERDEIDGLWFTELVKFTMKYGKMPATPI